jgi:hypothetical protein
MLTPWISIDEIGIKLTQGAEIFYKKHLLSNLIPE